MERDLYGELLSRALNRGAPQGHFAAYITPQEGGALRAMGGGVAPGGGQFMANGIPSFQEFGGIDPGIAEPTGPTGGYGSAGFEMGFTDPSLPGYSGVSGVSQADVDAAEQAMGLENPLGRAERAAMARQMAAARMAEVARRSAPVTVQALPAVSPTIQAAINTELEKLRDWVARDVKAGMPTMFSVQPAQQPAPQAVPASEITAATMPAAPVSVPAVPETLHERAARNLAAINSDYRNTERRGPPGTPATYTEAGREALARDISKGGIGSEAPGTTLANNNPTATTEDVATVNQHSDRTGGYSVNDPYSDVSVPAGMNMGLVPAAMGTLAGFVSPAMSLGMTFSDIPTLGTMGLEAALDFARTDTGALGTAARGLQQEISTITNPINTALGIVTEPIDRLGGFLGGRVRAGASAVGNFIDENVVDPITGEITNVVSSIGRSLPSFPGLEDVLFQGETPIGTLQNPQTGGDQEEAVVAIPPQVAPVTEPLVSGGTERQFAEIPPEILARILANVEFGRQRQQQQQQELGLV